VHNLFKIKDNCIAVFLNAASSFFFNLSISFYIITIIGTKNNNKNNDKKIMIIIIIVIVVIFPKLAPLGHTVKDAGSSGVGWKNLWEYFYAEIRKLSQRPFQELSLVGSSRLRVLRNAVGEVSLDVCLETVVEWSVIVSYAHKHMVCGDISLMSGCVILDFLASSWCRTR